MPCSDSSSSISLRLDHDERFVSFEFAKITCGREITGETGYSRYCRGKSLREILDTAFSQIVKALKIETEEGQFILYLEWDSLRSAAAQYLGIESDEIDTERCRITSVEQDEEGIEIAQVILPPKELPKILPCNLAES